MFIKIHYRHMNSTPSLEAKTREKSERLQKLWHGQINLEWTFTVEKHSHIAHCHLTGDHVDFFAEATTDSEYKSIDEVMEALEAQLRKNKGHMKNHHVQRRAAAKITSEIAE